MEEKIQKLAAELTLEEKIGMIHGEALFHTKAVKRLGIPELRMSDGPMGVRNEFPDDSWAPIGNSDDYVTYLPCNSALAATWNRRLAQEAGQVLGEEARGRGKDVILAPGINVQRSPLCGRNFEYMSEDPYLISEMAVPLIKGIQESDVAACVKHFAVNNQETERLQVNAELSERALREIYLPAFEAAVLKGHTYSIMGAYNKLRGEHCSQSKALLNDLLEKEWGYDGTVISDWGAVHDTREAAEANIDIEMAVTSNFDEYFMAQPLKEAVEKGEIEEELIDRKVVRILRMMDRLHMLHGERKAGCYNTPEHREKVLDVARESVILLKNEEKILPLKREKLKKLLVIGSNAERIHSNGGGSAEIKALYEISPLMGLKSKLGGNTEVIFARGYFEDGSGNSCDADWQSTSTELTPEQREAIRDKEEQEAAKERERLLKEAVALAGEIEDVVIIGGLNHHFDTEMYDRDSMQLPYEQDTLISEVLKVNPNAVVVMLAGSPVDMSAWTEQAKAVVWSWYAGMEGGNALAEILLGIVNPSGKLPVTLGNQPEDYGSHKLGEFPGADQVVYRDDIYVGYRYFDTYKIEPQFCFGHGLSYTQFAYADMTAEKTGETEVKIRLKVSNTGNRKGAEVVQIYVKAQESRVERPEKELKGFEKTELEPGETKTVEILLDRRAFAYYEEERKEFIVESGAYTLMAGSSSRDIRFIAEIRL